MPTGLPVAATLRSSAGDSLLRLLALRPGELADHLLVGRRQPLADEPPRPNGVSEGSLRHLEELARKFFGAFEVAPPLDEPGHHSSLPSLLSREEVSRHHDIGGEAGG